MDMAVVAVMAVVMLGAVIWCWRIENLPEMQISYVIL